ncbi:hypothetical protein BG011_000802 [Mortierella polycephala]|uniref:FAS1 domain-containing protein n=1 Tax=Mortierella polycephala TaxID=41804 RepID=A0A9P6PLU2_9FUNG|nr:hypothetical protein BG011_000802 [Mortierella polycephala]
MRPRLPIAYLFFLFIVLIAPPITATKTVIDLISSDPGFSRLIKEVQRHRLIPVLNNRKSCTFFAPTNAAFSKWDIDHPGKKLDKDTLLYHILPETKASQDLKDAMLLETILVKNGYLGDNHEGQLVAVARPSWRPGRRNKVLVGDAELLEKDWQADNGVVHVVDRLLIPPVDLVDTMQKHEKLSVLYNLIHSADLDDLLRQHHPFTLFAPTTSALRKLNEIQVRYLQHSYGRMDLKATFHHHIHQGTLYKHDVQPGTSSASTLEGQELIISLEGDRWMVDNAEIEQTDILASNGVIHTVSRPLLPSSLVWTAAKYLVGLNAMHFVDAMRRAGMTHYIDDPQASYTIFAPQDDSFNEGWMASLLEPQSAVLKYHVVPGRKMPSSFQDGQLLETELVSEFLNGQAQRSKITLKQDHKRTVVSVNGIEVKGEPVQVGKSVIYLVARPLEAPPPLLEMMKQEASLSEFVQALHAAGLDRKLVDASGITVFAPSASAWKDLGVVSNYLMLNDNSSLAALDAVLRYTIVEDIHYTPDIKAGRTVWKTSQGSDLVVEKNGNAIYVGEGRLERSTQVGGSIINKDILVEPGVVHAVSAVALPPSLSITLFNVLQGAETKTFLKAFETSNITRILSNWEQDFTVFAPTDEAFQKAQLEGVLNDLDFVARLVRLHVIPGKVLKLEEDIHDDEAMKGARSKKEARIISVGRAHSAWPAEENPGDRSGHLAVGMKYQHADLEDTMQKPRMVMNPRPGGVVYVIDRVLLPGDPDRLSGAWFWISIIMLGLLGTATLCVLTAISVYALVQELRGLEGYQPVATTDEESAAEGVGEPPHTDAPASASTSTVPPQNQPEPDIQATTEEANTGPRADSLLSTTSG